MDAAFSFFSGFRQSESVSPQYASTFSRSLESPPSPSTFKLPQIPNSKEESIPNKSIVKPAAAAKSGFSYEKTVAEVKQLEKEYQEKPVSFTLSSTNFLRLEKDLKLTESEKRYDSS